MTLDDRMRHDLGANIRNQVERVLEQHFNVARQVMGSADVGLMAMEICCSIAGGLILVPIQAIKEGGDRDKLYEELVEGVARHLRDGKPRLFAALDAKIQADQYRQGAGR